MRRKLPGGVKTLLKKVLCGAVAAVLFCLPSLSVSAEPGILVQAIPDAQGEWVGAKAAIVMEAETGQVLFAQNMNDRLPIASTTKIITALMALEQPDLDEVFEVDADAIHVEGSSMGLQEGDKATLRALATGMLLASGNDAANATAVRISGSVPMFVSAMNQRVQIMGLADTSFETPSGLDGENHYSSAYDMAMIAREALSNPEFAAICSQYKMRTSYGNPPYERWLTNHNRLLNSYEGTIGLKTGFTKKSGRCLVSAARRDGVTLICVTLSCSNDWKTHEGLYDRFFGQVQVEDLSKNAPQVNIPVTGGMLPAVSAVQLEPAQVPVPTEGAVVTYRVTAPPFLYAPIRSGQYIGEVEISLNGRWVRTLSLIAAEDVPLNFEYVPEKPTFWDWLEKFWPQKDE